MNNIFFILIFSFHTIVVFSQSNVFSTSFNYTADTSHLNGFWNTPSYGSDGFGYTIELEDSSLLTFGGSRRNSGNIIEEQRTLLFFFKFDKFGNLLDSTQVNLREGRIFGLGQFIELDDGVLGYGIDRDTLGMDNKLLFVKFDFNGDTLWTKSKRAEHQRPTSLYFTGEHYYCMSNLNPPTSAGIHGDILYKFDLDFNLEDSIYYDWISGYDYEWNTMFTMINDTSLYLFNQHNFYDYVNYRTKIGLIKMDTLGNVDWHKYHSIDPHIVSNIKSYLISRDNKNIYMGGMVKYEITDLHENAFIIKTDINGNLIWKKEFDMAMGSREEVFNIIKETANGNLLISGFSHPDSGFNPVTRPWLLKIDTMGELIWQRFLRQDSLVDKYSSLNIQTISKDGGIILTGSFDTEFVYGYEINNLHDAWLLKTDSCGFTTNNFPEPSFVVDSMINQTVYISNTSDNYCTAVLHFGNGDSTTFYAYENPRPNLFTYTYADTGTYTISLTALAGEEFVTYTNSITILEDTTVAIKEIEIENFEVSLFPNPAKESLNIVFGEEMIQKISKVKAKFFNFSGKEIFTNEYSTNIQKQIIDISKWTNGVYHIRFYTQDNQNLGTKKFVILR